MGLRLICLKPANLPIRRLGAEDQWVIKRILSSGQVGLLMALCLRFQQFLGDNDNNQILYRFSDSGKNEDLPTDTEYLYANSKAVEETGNDVKAENVTAMPGTGSLQSIVAAIYDNPSQSAGLLLNSLDQINIFF